MSHHTKFLLMFILVPEAIATSFLAEKRLEFMLQATHLFHDLGIFSNNFSFGNLELTRDWKPYMQYS